MNQLLTLQAFFMEFQTRIMSDNPKFFKVLQYAGVIASLLVKIPDFLRAGGCAIPDVLPAPYSTVIFVCGLVLAFIARLPNVDAPKA